MTRLHHRPRRFVDICGQDHVVRTLQAMLQRQRLPWVLLLTGPSGTGKTSLAHVLARAVNCDRPVAGEPCLECDSCRNYDELFVRWDCATERGVADVNQMIKRAQVMVPVGKRRVILADECHQLTSEAQDRLLAELERDEMARLDPSSVYPSMYIFGTTELQRLKTALVSRCCHLPLRGLPDDVVISRLHAVAQANVIPLHADASELIAALSRGNLRTALGYLEQIAAAPDVPWYEALQRFDPRLVKDLVAHLWTANREAALASLKGLLQGQEHRLPELIQQLLALLVRVVLEPSQSSRTGWWMAIIDTLTLALRLSRTNSDAAAASLYTHLGEILNER